MTTVAPVRRNDHWPQDGIVAGSTQAAQAAARATATQQRAIQGFQAATGHPPPGASVRATAVADAGANARTALTRPGLSADVRAHVENVLQRLGNGIMDGTIEPNINDTFRSHLYDLATEPVGSGRYRGALAQLTRAAQVLDQVKLASGTKLAYDPAARTSEPTRAGLPILNVNNIDADLYFKTPEGTLHIESAKHNAWTFANTLDKATSREALGQESQMSRHSTWASGTTTAEPRQAGYYMFDKNTGFPELMQPQRMSQLEKSIPVASQGNRNIVIGDRAYSFNELNDLSAKIKLAADNHVATVGRTWSGPGAFDAHAASMDFYNTHAGTPDAVMRNFPAKGSVFSPKPGQQEPTLDPLAMPSVKEGSIWGGVAGGGLSAVRQISQGNFTLDGARQVATDTASGGVIGGVMAKGEQLLTPVIDRAIGPAVEARAGQAFGAIMTKAEPLVMPVVNRVAGTGAIQQKVAQFFGSAVSVGGSESAGLAARTVVSRVAGSTAVGVAVTTALSAWENRDGLAHGDSKAIGNVAADAVVGGASIAGATLAGAAIGSVIPVGGTIVGGIIGFGVGFGITYGAQVLGVRDKIASGVASGVDALKSGFSHGFDAVKSWL
jgi:hypothetical protein